MPELTDRETQRLLENETPRSTGSFVSVNVDGSASETEDVAADYDHRVILASSDVNGDYHDAETASIHSDSTDGGQGCVPETTYFRSPLLSPVH